MKKKSKYCFYCLFFVLLLFFSACRDRDRSMPGQERDRRGFVDQPLTQTVVRMRQEGGVYHIPCKINGIEMEFVFDTGASDITMSLTEALFLFKQGKLSKSDFREPRQYKIADGSIHEGMVVVIQNVEIGNRTLHNVQASIVDNMEAPLLLGQSALARFGRISIDYNRNQITFE